VPQLVRQHGGRKETKDHIVVELLPIPELLCLGRSESPGILLALQRLYLVAVARALVRRQIC
jgi:hypothetical protein